MRTPLIVSFDPRISLKGPNVFIADGKWLLRGNYKNREIYICHADGSTRTKITEEIRITGPSEVYAEIVPNNQYSPVTIYAERID